MRKSILLLAALCLPLLLCAQGKLTAYYAKTPFGDYKKGQLIVDTNDPINRMVNYNKKKFKYEGDDTGGYYSQLILKSQVTVKVYQMSPLPVAMIGDGVTFRSTDGFTVRIFPAKANGHAFYAFDEEFVKYLDEKHTEALQQHYVISGTLKIPYDPEGLFFEDPLEIEDANIKLYRTGAEVGYGCDVKGQLRYRPQKIGFIEDAWTTPDDYGEKSAYDARGNMLVDQQKIVDIPEYLSIAWIATENALYINGTLYYKQ